ncbi:helicase 2 [Bacillus phage SBP8a]|nr:helicase 2 [Bacillus phage SBP8a]
MIIRVGNSYTTVDFQNNVKLQDEVREYMHHQLGLKDPNAIHSRVYKLGHWDGITDYYDMKNDKFPTGFLDKFLEGIRHMQTYIKMLTYTIEDDRPSPLIHQDSIDEEITVMKKGEVLTLHDYQYASVKQSLAEQTGVVNLATNAGKTFQATGLIKILQPLLDRDERICFMVHSKDILQQARDSICEGLGIDIKETGLIGEGKFDVKNKKLVFAMSPSLASALSDPKKGVSLTAKERMFKKMSEDIAPRFIGTVNTKTLIKNFLKNWTPKTKNDLEIEEALTVLAYDNTYSQAKVQMELMGFKVKFEKVLEKKNKKNFDKWKQANDFVNSVRVLIADECQRAKGDTWYNNVLAMENAQYRIGLTGTVDPKDVIMKHRLEALFGNIIAKVSNDEMIKRGISSKPRIRVLEVKEPRSIELAENYLEAYKLGIAENDYRTGLGVKMAITFYEAKKAGVVLTVTHIEHGNRAVAMLQEKGYEVGFLHGDLTLEERTDLLTRFDNNELHFLVASTIIDEGISINSIGCMVLLNGGKSMRQILQRIGRGLRLNGVDGNQTVIFDFVDMTHRILKSHSKERLRLYKEEKFDVKLVKI